MPSATRLERIPLLRDGERLQQGATYIDLRDERPREITAVGGMIAGRDGWFVATDSVGYDLRNRLIGVDTPDRLRRTG